MTMLPTYLPSNGALNGTQKTNYLVTGASRGTPTLHSLVLTLRYQQDEGSTLK